MASRHEGVAGESNPVFQALGGTASNLPRRRAETLRRVLPSFFLCLRSSLLLTGSPWRRGRGSPFPFFEAHPTVSPSACVRFCLMASKSYLVRKINVAVMPPMLSSCPSFAARKVGGLERAKSAVQEMVVWPARFPETFSRMGISPASGILLFGPPGKDDAWAQSHGLRRNKNRSLDSPTKLKNAQVSHGKKCVKRRCGLSVIARNRVLSYLEEVEKKKGKSVLPGWRRVISKQLVLYGMRTNVQFFALAHAVCLTRLEHVASSTRRRISWFSPIHLAVRMPLRGAVGACRVFSLTPHLSRLSPIIHLAVHKRLHMHNNRDWENSAGEGGGERDRSYLHRAQNIGRCSWRSRRERKSEGSFPAPFHSPVARAPPQVGLHFHLSLIVPLNSSA